MRLIGSALSPYAVRVMIAARYKGIELAFEPIPGGARSAAHLALNPIGKVPVLVDGSVVLPESDAIVWYLEDRFPEPTLLPGDAAQRANVRLLCRLLDTYSTPSFGPFIVDDPPGVATAIERSGRGCTPGGRGRAGRIRERRDQSVGRRNVQEPPALRTAGAHSILRQAAASACSCHLRMA